MSFVRHYVMQASAGRTDELVAALRRLGNRLRTLSGLEATEILSGASDPTCVVFIERWKSADAQAHAGASLGREGFAEVMATLAERPTSLDLRPL